MLKLKSNKLYFDRLSGKQSSGQASCLIIVVHVRKNSRLQRFENDLFYFDIIVYDIVFGQLCYLFVLLKVKPALLGLVSAKCGGLHFDFHSKYLRTSFA